MPETARKTALTILNALSDNMHSTLDMQVEKYLGSNSTLSRRDKALTTALVYGVLRWRGQLDYIIKKYSKTPFQKINPYILNILRLGIFQIHYLDKIPVSAAVNTSVDLSKNFGKAWAPKFVNGILRNISRTLKDVSFPELSEKQPNDISIQKSFPKWLIHKWISRFGIKDTLRLCDALNEIPSITLRVNTLRASRDELSSKIKQKVKHLSPTAFSPLGLVVSGLRDDIFESTVFHQGYFQVQDEAAQLVSYLLAPKPGERILDACAGLGVKTAHIAQFMENSGSIVAFDLHGWKLKRLKSEMTRLGITICKTRVFDIGKDSYQNETEQFDKVLIDAPCSGMGVIRRNPDTKWAGSKKDLNRYGNRQELFLKNMSPLVKPGGIIVYSVCSIEPEECETVVHSFLSTHPNFEIDDFKGNLPSMNSLFSDAGFLRTFPHEHDMDGFFAVRLKRIL